MAPELITASVEWYQTHLGYQLCLLAGRKRVDLHGNDAGTVTEYEQRVAQKKALAIREKMKRDREATSAAASVPPVKYGTVLPPKFLTTMSAPAMTTNSKPTTIAPAAPVMPGRYANGQMASGGGVRSANWSIRSAQISTGCTVRTIRRSSYSRTGAAGSCSGRSITRNRLKPRS